MYNGKKSWFLDSILREVIQNTKFLFLCNDKWKGDQVVFTELIERAFI